MVILFFKLTFAVLLYLARKGLIYVINFFFAARGLRGGGVGGTGINLSLLQAMNWMQEEKHVCSGY